MTGIQIIERSVYRGPNPYGRLPMIRIQIDLGLLEDYPTSRLPGFADRLLALLPGLAEHGCSHGTPGGLIMRMADGTWLGHVIEHVAIELQRRAGSTVTRGKTRSVGRHPGRYNVLYTYDDESVGLAAGLAAIRLVAALLPPHLGRVEGLQRLGAPSASDPIDVEAEVAPMRTRLARLKLGPSTQAIVDAARRRNIPVLRLDELSLIQFGLGSRQRRIRASVSDATSLIAAELAADKARAKALLADAGLPVPRGAVVRSVDEALALRMLRFPLVIKPLDGNHGRGVTTGIASAAAIPAAYALAAAHSRRVIVEEHLPGEDHRILVVDGRMVAAARRLPARVVGDGRRSIAELIDAINADPRRGHGHADILTRVVPDAAMKSLLASRGISLATVPVAGQVVTLRGTANLSTGGTASDCTDAIHPDNVAIAEQAARIIGLDIAGVDFLSPDITRPVRETGGGIVEINAAPGLRMHLAPSEGSPRDVGTAIVDMLYPPHDRARRHSRIPIFAITGTNGKSTTVRMLARILGEAGLRVGMTSTSGIYIDNHLLVAGDASGPKSARMVLRSPVVDVAVLETARGGIVREGLGFDRCDVGAVLNVSADHLGLKGIETVEDLARLKAVVVENVARRGTSVLNADDPLTIAMARRAGGTIAWFSCHGGEDMPPHLAAHVAAGGLAAVREPGTDGGTIVLHRKGKRQVVIAAPAIPATLDGAAAFNIKNALAATAMAAAHGIPIPKIAAGLASFTTSFEDSPGRLNIHDTHDIRVIVDYAHNPAALAALGELVASLRSVHGRVFGMVSIPGDRRDDDLRDMGRLAAGIFDEIMFREAPDGRGRPAGSINALMAQGALDAGKPPENVHKLVDEQAATAACLDAARPGDLIVLMPTDVEGVWAQVHDWEPVAVSQRQCRPPRLGFQRKEMQDLIEHES